MNLAYRFPTVFWNCACLISDSGGGEIEDDDDEEIEDVYEYSDTMEEFVEIDEDEDDDEEVEVKKKKKNNKTADYGKIATAIGKMKEVGINVNPPDINASSYTFSPDPENNIIRYGMSGIVKVGKDIVKEIIDNRPYASIWDFEKKVKVNKPQMVNLIKAGAFDSFGDRIEIMKEYISVVSEPKKRVTLQNLAMLIRFGLIPQDFDKQIRVFNFSKYLKKKEFKDGNFFLLDNIAFNFYEKNFPIDDLTPCDKAESGFAILKGAWDVHYQKHMDIIRPFVSGNKERLLKEMNQCLFDEVWNKYCAGSISKWEMDSVSYYSHEHELAHVHSFADYAALPDEPEVDKILTIKGKQIPIFKIQRIAGTVLDKDKNKKIVTLLTTSGVVTVKIYGGAFSFYDKQISAIGADGKKHVQRPSDFKRGNKIIVTGIKTGQNFLAKKYKATPWHLVELITEVNEDGTIVTSPRSEEMVE